MMTHPRLNGGRDAMTTATLSTVAAGFRHHPISCFAAGFISVLVFQMGAWGIMYALGMTPNPPFGYAPTKPFGVPQIFLGWRLGLSLWRGRALVSARPHVLPRCLPVRRDCPGSGAL